MGSLNWLVCSCALMAAEPGAMVLNFTATWCGPCQSMSPMVSRLQQEGLPIRKIDIDREPALMRHFGVTSVPAFVLVINGQAVERTVGRQDEASLRRMLAKATSWRPPQVPDLPGAENLITVQADAPKSAPRSPGGRPVSNPGEIRTASTSDAPLWSSKTSPNRSGETDEQTDPGATASRPLPKSAPANPASDRSVAEQSKPSRGFSFPGFGGRGKPAAKPAVLRGQTGESPFAHLEPSPLTSTVRIRVSDAKGENFGTGTVIDSRTGRTLVLTCGHIFRNLEASSKIVVEAFLDSTGDNVQTYTGKVLRYDLKADCGLIQIAAEGLPVTRVASPDIKLIKGAPVKSIGCGGGDKPKTHQMRITALNRYLGPDNIECDDLPIEGRSGGGLFTKEGVLIGVCTAADKNEKRGIYCGLNPIHRLLDACGLSSVYRETTPEFEEDKSLLVDANSADAIDQATPNAESTDLDESVDSQLASNRGTSSRDAAPEGDAVDEQDVADLVESVGPAEVVCVIRPIDRPRDATRVVVINRASPRFLSYLSGEVDQQDSVQKTALARPRPLPLATPNRDVPDEFVSTPGDVDPAADESVAETEEEFADEPAPTRYRRR